MNKGWLLGAFLCSFLLAGVAEARDLRIGVVNMQRAVSETKEGQAAEGRLKKMKDDLEGSLNRKLKEFYQDQENFKKAAAVLKEDERKKRQAEGRQKLEALQKEYMDAERKLMSEKTKVMQKISEKLGKVIEKLAKEQKYDYIFANAAVLWAPQHVDLTNEVIRRYNQ